MVIAGWKISSAWLFWILVKFLLMDGCRNLSEAMHIAELMRFFFARTKRRHNQNRNINASSRMWKNQNYKTLVMRIFFKAMVGTRYPATRRKRIELKMLNELYLHWQTSRWHLSQYIQPSNHAWSHLQTIYVVQSFYFYFSLQKIVVCSLLGLGKKKTSVCFWKIRPS